MRFAVPILVALVATAAADVIFSEDFEDGNADGWYDDPGVTYEVIDGEYCFSGDNP